MDFDPSIFRIFARILDPFLLSSMVMLPLFGISVAQTIFYFRSYHADHYSKKGLVLAVLVLETLHTACISHTVQALYLRAEVSLYEPPSFPVSLFVSYVNTALVQSAFSYRVWILYENKMIRIALVSLIIIQLCSAIVIGIGQVNLKPSETDRLIMNTVSGTISVSSAILCDLLISASLTRYLWVHRSRATDRTKSLLTLLIVYTVGIGALTVIISVTHMIMFCLFPRRFTYLAFQIVLSKLYANALLVSLNSRNMLRTWGRKGPALLWESGRANNAVPLSIIRMPKSTQAAANVATTRPVDCV
ncbi:hypothetical protein ONZ45_g7601 [Pleurotus djamor]|nr:hypothetical protein ONZ45_g7601 [Pleurotus djamor]